MSLDFYQHIPEYINPIAFSIGFFSIRWYSIMWLVGITVIYFLLRQNIKKKEVDGSKLSNDQFQKLFLYILIGLLIGGRLGYVLFYDPAYFIQSPLEIFLPFKFTAYCLSLTGFYGMSYHGGMIGAILAGIIFANPSPRKLGTPFMKGRDKPYNFWKLADWIIPAVPAGYFFGRIGNFLNGELYGRATDMLWGMYFPADWLGQLRHPSQLYEAFFEGIVLFILLWILSGLLKNKWRKYYFPGILFLAYIFSYSFFRFFLEFFRELDTQIGFILWNLSMGQILSIGMVVLAVIIFWRKGKGMVYLKY